MDEKTSPILSCIDRCCDRATPPKLTIAIRIRTDCRPEWPIGAMREAQVDDLLWGQYVRNCNGCIFARARSSVGIMNHANGRSFPMLLPARLQMQQSRICPCKQYTSTAI